VHAGPFALNCRTWWAPQIRNGDVVRWFHGAAQTAPVHERDIAAVAARALCDEGHEDRDYRRFSAPRIGKDLRAAKRSLAARSSHVRVVRQRHACAGCDQILLEN